MSTCDRCEAVWRSYGEGYAEMLFSMTSLGVLSDIMLVQWFLGSS